MATLLFERRISFEGLSFVLLKSPYAEALAVEVAPSIESATTATRLVRNGRSDGTLKPFGTLDGAHLKLISDALRTRFSKDQVELITLDREIARTTAIIPRRPIGKLMIVPYV